MGLPVQCLCGHSTCNWLNVIFFMGLLVGECKEMCHKVVELQSSLEGCLG